MNGAPDSCGSGGGTLRAGDVAADEGGSEEDGSCEPRAEADRGWRVPGDCDAARDQGCGEDAELPHAVHEDERKIMSA